VVDAVGVGAAAMINVTVVSGGTSWPSGGSLSITVPGGALVLGTNRSRAASPRRLNAC
jgi:hypothetical protein